MTAVVRDRAVVAATVARVWAADEVVGGAFLVAPGVVATTASVVAEAVGSDPGTGGPPTGIVELDFPLLLDDDDVPVRAAARVQRWPAGAAEGFGDLALLRLIGVVPPSVQMPPLRRVQQLAGCSFSVLGFPAGLADGVWVTGRIRAEQGAQRHRLDEATGEQRIDAGFAGAPVWEARTGAVVGMVVPRRGAGGADLLPIEEVIGLDPEQLPCPYQGLRAFDEADADTFFGRDADIQRLVDAVERLPVVAVAGPSGAGKSSLVRAGLVPRLRAAGAEIVHLRAEPGATLDEVLPRVEGRAQAGDRGPVLVLDQFEELAALDPAAARAMLEAIAQRTDPAGERPVRAVLTVRWTTLDELLTAELIDLLDAGIVLVGPLDRDRLQEAIVRPAQRPPGLAFEPGLVDAVLDDAGAEPGRLPLVESLLTELWERRIGGFLTMADYQAVGGVAGALAHHAEGVVGALPPETDGTVRRLLTALARPDRDGRFVRRPLPLGQLPAAQRALVPALTTGRLLVVSSSAPGTDIVEFAHQALIDHWPRLRTWLVADSEFLSWREQVGNQRERWEAEGHEDTGLLRGAVLARAAEWLPTRKEDLAPADLDFVRRSTARQRRDLRRWRIITAVVATLTLAAAALAVIAVRSGDRIAAQLAVANADTLGREAQARAAQDPATAARLALAAWREDPPSPQARTALARSYLAMRSVHRELPDLTGEPITRLHLGGDTAVLVADPHPVVVRGLSTPTPSHEGLPDVASDRQLALSPDGRWMADQVADRSTLRLRDLTTGTGPVPLPAVAGTRAGLPAFSPGSDRLAWLVFDDGTGTAALRIWDLRTGAEVPHGVGPMPADTGSVTLTPATDRVVVRRGDVESPDSRLVVLSLADGAELATLPAGGRTVLGGTAVATCEDRTGAPGSTATVVVTPVDGGPSRRIRTIGPFCDGSSISGTALSGNQTALIEKHFDESLQITDLRSGEVFHLAAPGELPWTPRPTFATVPTIDVLSAGAGTDVVTARGSSLLWLRGEPPPDRGEVGPGEQIVHSHDQFRVVGTEDGFFTSERGTGRRMAELPGVRDPNSQAWPAERSLWNARIAADGWRLTRYELPMLLQANEILLPSRDGGAPPGDRGHAPSMTLVQEPPVDGGRLLLIADGVLSAWDPNSARPAGPPVPLGTTELQIGFHRSYPHLHARPGHPGHAAVLGPHDVQIWDVSAGRLVITLPAGPSIASLRKSDSRQSPIAFDPTGDRLAVLREDHTVQLWDVEAGRPVGAPIPAPTTSALLGFDLDGYLVVVPAAGTPARLAFVDPESGAESELPNPPGVISDLGDDRRTVRLDPFPGGEGFDLPITAQGWRDGLCAVLDRPFTAGEQRLLPPGTGTDPPCS